MIISAPRTVLLVTGLLVGGCATTGTVASAPDQEGRLLRFQEPCEVLVAVVPPTLRDLGFVLESSLPADPCGLTVVAVKPASLASWGEFVRVIVEPDVDGGAAVRVLTRRALATNLTAIGDWSKRIHRALLEALQEHPHAGP